MNGEASWSDRTPAAIAGYDQSKQHAVDAVRNAVFAVAFAGDIHGKCEVIAVADGEPGDVAGFFFASLVELWRLSKDATGADDAQLLRGLLAALQEVER